MYPHNIYTLSIISKNIPQTKFAEFIEAVLTEVKTRYRKKIGRVELQELIIVRS